ncbi:MAG TPA: hypothetical protein VGK31_07440 [Thermoanaerobaculia bacterium]|jgi:hypothetical protein
MHNDDYEQSITRLEASIEHSTDRITQMVKSYHRSLDLLVKVRGGELTHEESAVLRNLEALVAEVLHVSTMLFHRRGEHASAHQMLAFEREIQTITMSALEPTASHPSGR